MSSTQCPSGRYPLSRPRWLWALWGLAVVISVVVLILWCLHGAGIGVEVLGRGSAGLVLCGVCAACGYQGVRSLPEGMLCWDETGWAVLRTGWPAMRFDAPLVVVDAQWMLVLAFRRGPLSWQHVVVQKDAAADGWYALRRAVYSSASSTQARTLSSMN